MGKDPHNLCSRPIAKSDTVNTTITRMASESGSSDEDDTPRIPVQGSSRETSDRELSNAFNSESPVPLVDYILNVVSINFICPIA